MANASLPNEAVKEIAVPISTDTEKLDQQTVNDLLAAMDEIERGEGIPIEELEAEFNRTIWR